MTQIPALLSASHWSVSHLQDLCACRGFQLCCLRHIGLCHILFAGSLCLPWIPALLSVSHWSVSHTICRISVLAMGFVCKNIVNNQFTEHYLNHILFFDLFSNLLLYF